MVYQALQGRMGGELHALALQTSVPAEPRGPAEPPAIGRASEDTGVKETYEE
jgi:hypothetical protein